MRKVTLSRQTRWGAKLFVLCLGFLMCEKPVQEISLVPLYDFRLDLEQRMCCKSVTCLPSCGLYSSCEAVSKESCREINLIALIPISLMQTS